MSKSTKIIAAAAVSLLAAFGAQAETYEGVHPLTAEKSRAEVAAEARAVNTAGAYNAYSDAAFAGVQPVTTERSRAEVNAEAVAAAHNPLQNLDSKAFVNSRIPEQFVRGAEQVRQQASGGSQQRSM